MPTIIQNANLEIVYVYFDNKYSNKYFNTGIFQHFLQPIGWNKSTSGRVTKQAQLRVQHQHKTVSLSSDEKCELYRTKIHLVTDIEVTDI